MAEGTSGYFLYLKRSLQALGHRVDLIFRDSFINFTGENSVVRAMLFPIFPILILPIIFIKMLVIKYDAVVISSGDGFLFGLWKKIFFRKKPLFIMLSHGLEHLLWKQLTYEKKIDAATRIGLKQAFFMSFVRLLEVDASLLLSDSIFIVSEKEKRHLGGKRFLKHKVNVLYPGIDDIFLTQKNITRDRELLFVGNWVPLKGVQYLVKIFLELLNKFNTLSLTVIGANVKEEYVLQDFPEYSRKFVRIVPTMSQQGLSKEYLRHRIFLFPSLYEGFSRVAMEAMASKMAVCVTESLGISEIIQHGLNGFLAPARDVLRFTELVSKLLDDEKLCDFLGENAFNTVKEMDWRRTADIFINSIIKTKK